MSGRLLAEAEFQACLKAPMRDVTDALASAVDIWPYVDLLDLPGIGIAELGDVERVYRSADGRYDHVLIGTGTNNVFLAIVVDTLAPAVLGHRLLDLNIEYGISTSD